MERLLGEADPGAVGNSDDVEPAPLMWGAPGREVDAPVDWGPVGPGYGPGSPPPPAEMSLREMMSERLADTLQRFRWERIVVGLGVGIAVLAAVVFAFRSQDQAVSQEASAVADANVLSVADQGDAADAAGGIGGDDGAEPESPGGGLSGDVAPPTTTDSQVGVTLERPTTAPTVATTAAPTTPAPTTPTTVETTATTVETTSTETTAPSSSSSSSTETTETTQTVPVEPLRIADPGLQEPTLGDQITLALSAAGGDGTPRVWSAERLPAGLSINPDNGTISGEVREQGISRARIRVADATYDDAITVVWFVI